MPTAVERLELSLFPLRYPLYVKLNLYVYKQFSLSTVVETWKTRKYNLAFLNDFETSVLVCRFTVS